MSSEVTLIDFVNTVPQPVVAILIQCAPFIAAVRFALQLVSWRRPWYDSCLVIVSWWAICLLADSILRYLLPIITVFVVTTYTFAQREPITTTTEMFLHNIVTDMMIIHHLLPSQPIFPPLKSFSRVVAAVYIPYLYTTHYVPLRILFGIFGTFLLVTRAPFLSIVSSTLSRSAWLRWSSRYFLSWVTQKTFPNITLSHQPTPAEPTPSPSFRFLFTICENQRWWMGLDWTAALLPNERPSWCTPEPGYQPVSPPNVFVLPSPAMVYTRDSMGRRIRRKASWSWEEHEWKVILRREGVGSSRIERPIPEDNQNAGGESQSAGSRLLRAAGKMRESSIIGRGNLDDSGHNGDKEGRYDEEDPLRTDSDGWVYGDNKWEGLSSKGGIGKYTRFRRWTRVAVVSETVELVDDGPLGIAAPEGPSYLSNNHVHAAGTLTARPNDETPLRQRLRWALSKQDTPNS